MKSLNSISKTRERERKRVARKGDERRGNGGSGEEGVFKGFAERE